MPLPAMSPMTRPSLIAEGEEVVVVAADVASLDTDTGVVEGLERGEGLGEETGLDLLGDLELLGGAAIGFDLLGCDVSLLLDLARELVGADQLESVAVEVLKAGESDAEDGLLWRLAKVHTMALPEVVCGVDVFGEEADLRVASDEALFSVPGLGATSARMACPSGGATAIQRLS